MRKRASLSLDALVRELGFEANTRYIGAAHRSGVVVSMYLATRFVIRAMCAPRVTFVPTRDLEPGIGIAFSVFKNESDAIEEHLSRGRARWKHVRVDLAMARGLDFFGALAAGPCLFPGFARRLVRAYGWNALRRFFYPFLGYLVYHRLRRAFESFGPDCEVVTTNMSHPISVAIHSAARDAGVRTVFLEHAMTPRLIARDCGYDQLMIRSPHTVAAFIEKGVPDTRIEVLDYWTPVQARIEKSTRPWSRIGIAVNDLDGFETVSSVSAELIRRGFKCCLRVHQSDRRLEKFESLGRRLGIVVSSASTSNIGTFIGGQDIVIVGNSGVLLDCLRAGIPVVYFWTGEEQLFDYYGLVRFTNCRHARSIDELLGFFAQ